MAEAHFSIGDTCRRFWPLLRQQRKRVFGAFLTSLIASGLAVAAPLPVKIIIDDILHGKRPEYDLPQLDPVQLVIGLAIASALLAGFAALFSAWEKMMSARAREQLTLDMRLLCLDRLLMLTPLCRDGDRSGELSLRLVDDVQQVARLFTKTFPVILRYLFTLIFTLVALTWINPLLGGGALVIALLLTLSVRLAARPLAATARAKRKQEGRVAAVSQEFIRLLSFIQASGTGAEIRTQYAEANRKSLGAGIDETRAAVRLERAMQIANGLAVALVVGGGGVLALKGLVSAGDLAIAVIYLNQMLKPVEKINELASAVTGATSRAGRLTELMDRDQRLDLSGTHRKDRTNGSLSLSKPRFSYENGRSFAFDSIEIPARSVVSVEGPSGSGKSTLLALLTRLFDPAEGEIRLDGVAYTDWDIVSLRNQFALAPQAPPLLAGSVRSWLLLGNAGAEDSRLWKALHAVSLAETIFARGGLDVALGEGGAGFSGGEQARLSLARALIADRPVLMLDEPFANVDPVSADAMIAALRREKGRRTILIVSHQPLPDGFADKQLSLVDGTLETLSSPTKAAL